MNSKTKPTPGPWYREAFDSANGTAESVFAVVAETPVEICDCSADFPDGGVANARLIAAAPDLLEALIEARVVLAVALSWPGCESLRSKINVAIMKTEARP